MVIRKNKGKAKYPYSIYLDDGRVIPVPSQHRFKSDYIRRHGCSLVGFYMALRFLGVKKSMSWCKRYLDKNYGPDGHAKYSLRQVAAAINKIVGGKPATFKKPQSKETVQKALRKGGMVLFEERDPIHTVVLLHDGKKTKR